MKINHKRIRRKIIGFNFTAFFFFLLSCVSLTFAWFAYSNVVHTGLEIDVSAWHIVFDDGVEEISNEILIPINEFYPGISKYTKSIEILNKGDIDAEFSYAIDSLRILDKEFDTSNQEELFDKLAQEYPFLFNIEVDSNYIASKESVMLNIVIDWPLDSGNDLLDGKWGNDAHNFIENENRLKELDNNYEIRSVIEMGLLLNSRQYVEENKNITDNRFLYGNVYNFNINTLESCDVADEGCYSFFVIDRNNLLIDDSVRLILDTNQYIDIGSFSYVNSLITDKFKLPLADMLLEGISKDINDSTIVIDNYSERIVGNVIYNNRQNSLLNKVALNAGYIKFSLDYFNHLSSDNCYWTSSVYNDSMMYAVKNIDDNFIKLYGENKNTDCYFVPVIEVIKENIK